MALFDRMKTQQGAANRSQLLARGLQRGKQQRAMNQGQQMGQGARRGFQRAAQKQTMNQGQQTAQRNAGGLSKQVMAQGQQLAQGQQTAQATQEATPGGQRQGRTGALGLLTSKLLQGRMGKRKKPLADQKLAFRPKRNLANQTGAIT